MKSQRLKSIDEISPFAPLSRDDKKWGLFVTPMKNNLILKVLQQIAHIDLLVDMRAEF